MSSRKKSKRFQLPPPEIATEIKLHREQGADHVVAVEGKRDAACFGRFVDRSTTKVYPYGGKPEIIAAMSILKDAGIENVTSITDSDYDRLAGRNADSIQTDYVDREAYIWDKRSEFESQIESRFKESALQDSPSITDLVDMAILCAKCLGAIRYAHDQTPIATDDMLLCFEKFCFTKVDDLANDDEILSRITNCVFSCSNFEGALDSNTERIGQAFENHSEQDLCKGVDIVDATIALVDHFKLAGERFWKRRDDVQDSVNGLFTKEFLQTTQLYADFCSSDEECVFQVS